MAENVEQVLKELYDMNFARASRNLDGLFRSLHKELILVFLCCDIKKSHVFGKESKKEKKGWC